MVPMIGFMHHWQKVIVRLLAVLLDRGCSQIRREADVLGKNDGAIAKQSHGADRMT